LPTSADLLLDSSAALTLVNPKSAQRAGVLERVQGYRIGLAGHAEFETYSVLTRLPPPSRISPSEARAILTTTFPATVHPGGVDRRGALSALVDAEIAGGAAYDGLVALAAAAANCLLLSCDRRAAGTYLALGVRFEIL
jgi:toxin FitB